MNLWRMDDLLWKHISLKRFHYFRAIYNSGSDNWMQVGYLSSLCVCKENSSFQHFFVFIVMIFETLMWFYWTLWRFCPLSQRLKCCAFILYTHIRRKHSDFCFGKPLWGGRHYSSWLDAWKKTAKYFQTFNLGVRSVQHCLTACLFTRLISSWISHTSWPQNGQAIRSCR